MYTFDKIALIGAGAIGGFFIEGFDHKVPSFSVIAEGSRREKLKEQGVTVNGVNYRPTVCTPEEAGPQDLIILATKYNGLSDAVRMASQMTGPNTVALSVLNGIDSEEQLAAAIGKEHVLHSLMHIASRRFPDRIEIQKAENEGLIFGNAWLPEEKGREAVAALDQLLTKLGIIHRVASDILYEQWFKYASNVSYNLPQAVVGCGNGIYEDSEHAMAITNALWAEVRELATAKGIQLPETTTPWKVAKSSRFSTLQDLDAGRPTEVEMFAGVLVRKSREAGLAAPTAETIYHLIRLLEEKNAGRFEY